MHHTDKSDHSYDIFLGTGFSVVKMSKRKNVSITDNATSHPNHGTFPETPSRVPWRA